MPTCVSARTSRALALAAFSVFVVGCGGSGSTGPQTPSQYAGTYSGIADGAGVGGTVTIAVGQSASADVSGRPSLVAESNPNAVTVTLETNGNAPITMTGTISGNSVTVTSTTTPPVTCTVTFTATGATGSCTVPGIGVVSIAAFIQAAHILVTTYCGTQSIGPVPTAAPNATLGGLVSGSNMYLLVAPPSGSPTLFSGVLASGAVALTSTSSGAVYNGTEANGGAIIGGHIGTSPNEAWSVASPCTPGALTLSASTVTASATVGSTTSITPTPITVSNGGSGTLGVVTYDPPTFTPSATTGWLQVAMNSPTTTGGTLSLSISPTALAAGTYTAAVPVTGSLATGSPQTVTITLTINPVQTTPVLAVSPSSLTFTTTPGTAPASQTVSVTASGGTASGLSTTISYGSGSGWLTASVSPTTSPATITVAAPGATGLAAGNYSATVSVASTTTGVGSVQFTVHLAIQATPSLVVAPSTVTFTTTPGAIPQSQNLSVTASGGTASGLTTAVVYGSGSGWLTTNITPSATPAMLAVQAPGAATLAAGTYSATITVASTTSGVASVQIPVTLSIQAAAVSTGWVKVMAGLGGTFGITKCGIQSDGKAYCWGSDNRAGTLGDNSTKDSFYNPQPVFGGNTFKALASGPDFTCGVATSGAPYCWGNAIDGELGDNNPFGLDSTPQLVSNGLAFDSITGSLLENACGLTASGAAYCWGANGAGELGNDTSGTNTGLVPQRVVGGHTFVQIMSGNETTCAVDNAGSAWCWGIVGWTAGSGVNINLVLDSVPFLEPAPGPGRTWKQLAATNNDICGLADNGAAYCWGPNIANSLGAGLTGNLYTTPQAVTGGHRFSSIVTGPCAIEAGTDKLYCWGFVGFIGYVSGPTQYGVGLTFSQVSSWGYCGVTNGSTNNTEIYCSLTTTPLPVAALGLPAGSQVGPATISAHPAGAVRATRSRPPSPALR